MTVWRIIEIPKVMVCAISICKEGGGGIPDKGPQRALFIMCGVSVYLDMGPIFLTPLLRFKRPAITIY